MHDPNQHDGHLCLFLCCPHQNHLENHPPSPFSSCCHCWRFCRQDRDGCDGDERELGGWMGGIGVVLWISSTVAHWNSSIHLLASSAPSIINATSSSTTNREDESDYQWSESFSQPGCCGCPHLCFCCSFPHPSSSSPPPKLTEFTHVCVVDVHGMQ